MSIPSETRAVEDRKQREKEFHNKVFHEETRKRTCVERFYDSANSSKGFYKNYLQANCRNKRVLEYGCGPDGYSTFMARHGGIVTGIDISEIAIEQSRKLAHQERATGVDFRVMDAECLTFEDSTFDLICGTAILHHLDFRRALSEVSRTLKPDGSAAFIECLGHNPLINFYRKLTPHLRTEDEHPLLMSDLKIARDYFGKVETHFFHFASLMAIPFQKVRGAQYLSRALDSVDRFAFRFLPFMRKYSWAVVIVLTRPEKANSTGQP